MSVPHEDSSGQRPTAATHNDESPVNICVSFEELALKSGLDEDTLLQRIALILSRREADPNDAVISIIRDV